MSTDITINNNEIKIGLNGLAFDDILFCTGYNSCGINSFSFDVEDYYEYSDTFDYNIGFNLLEYLNDEIKFINIYKNDL